MWSGDHWQHAPDGQKQHDPQQWVPLCFDRSGNVQNLSTTDRWSVSIKTDDEVGLPTEAFPLAAAATAKASAAYVASVMPTELRLLGKVVTNVVFWRWTNLLSLVGYGKASLFWPLPPTPWRSSIGLWDC